MGWYSTPFNYDGTSPTQVRDDLQKANENFQALSDVFENGTPLSGKIKSSYIQGGGGNISGDIVVNSVTVSNPNRVNIGIDLSASTGGFYQAAIKMPVGVYGSMVGWIPATGIWGADSLIGVNTAGQFWVIGRPGSDGRKQVRVGDDLYVTGSVIPGSISILPSSAQNYALNLRSSAGFRQGCILMPTGGIGSRITWGDPPDSNSFIGIHDSNGHFVIIGKPDNTGRNKIYMSDDVDISGNLVVNGTITGNVVYQIPDTITLKKININADSGQDYGIKFSGSFSQTAILMPVGVYGSTIAWTPVNALWGADSLIGVNSSGQFHIIGRPTVAGGTKMIHMSDYVKISGDLEVTATITCKKINVNANANQDYGLSFRGSSGFSQGCILMPTGGTGSQITWSPSPDANMLIGLQYSTGRFVIIGKQDPSYNNENAIYLEDHVVIPRGKLAIGGEVGNVGSNILIYKDPSDGKAKIVGTPDSNNQGRNTLYVYSDFSAVGDAWVNGKIHVATSTGAAGITFRDVAEICDYSESAILMPRYGNGNFISWNPYPIAEYSYGLIGRRSDGKFVILGLPSGSAGSDAVVYLYDNVIVNKTLSATSIIQTSDLSMKENVVVLSDSALDLVKKIDVYEYSFRSDPDVRHVGFIANYVKDVFPHGVTIDGNGMCSINIVDMLALLFKAVKELAEHVANN